jgi:hypothetical protein
LSERMCVGCEGEFVGEFVLACTDVVVGPDFFKIT